MTKRGRKKLLDGSETIQRAEEMFRLSMEANDPDYRYVAMAIGASPLYPPDWAILACINLKMRTEMKPPTQMRLRTTDGRNVTGKVLDDAIRALALSHDPAKGLPAAIREAAERNGLHLSEAEIENLKNAWDREVEQSTVSWAIEPDEEHGLAPTRRAARVLRQMAVENGEAELGQQDQQAMIWLARLAGLINVELKFSKPEPK